MRDKPRVCIDGYNLGMEKGSGIATYARNLSMSLSALGMEVHVLYQTRQAAGRNNLMNEVALFDAATDETDNRKTGRWWRNRTSRLGRSPRFVRPTGEIIPDQIRWRIPETSAYWVERDLFHSANRCFRQSKRFTPVYFGLPWREPALDLMHWTTCLPMRAHGMPNIYTIHDLVPLRLPFATLDSKRAFYRVCQDICRTADLIITVSETSRQDIMRVFNVPPARIMTTYQAVYIPDKMLQRPQVQTAQEIEGAFNLGWKDYFLFFGALEPKKNIGRIIDAYLASNARKPLVIVGGRAWLNDRETEILGNKDILQGPANANQSGASGKRIRQFTYLPFPTLVNVIRGARATLFPSLYEGFGLPILESMLLGTAVVTSKVGSMLEVAGDATLLVDPYDVDSIREAIRALDTDDDLVKELEQRGRVQAQQFNEAAYQARLQEAYALVL